MIGISKPYGSGIIVADFVTRLKYTLLICQGCLDFRLLPIIVIGVPLFFAQTVGPGFEHFERE